MLQLPN